MDFYIFERDKHANKQRRNQMGKRKTASPKQEDGKMGNGQDNKVMIRERKGKIGGAGRLKKT